MKLMRLGDKYINLDLITAVVRWCDRPGEPGLSVCFSGDRESLRISNPEEVALLWNWLDLTATNYTDRTQGGLPPGQEG